LRVSRYMSGSGRAVSALFAITALTSGCAYLEQDLGSPLALDQVEQTEAGSHYSEVLTQFGPPSTMTALPGGLAFQYEYIRLVEWQWGLILPGEIGKWIKAVYGTANADIELMTFIFDADGMLRSADAQQWTADAGAGFSFSLIFSVGTLTDIERYTESSQAAHNWGVALTAPPLDTLNVRNSLETGLNGFELTATTPRAGQHTLELKN